MRSFVTKVKGTVKGEPTMPDPTVQTGTNAGHSRAECLPTVGDEGHLAFGVGWFLATSGLLRLAGVRAGR